MVLVRQRLAAQARQIGAQIDFTEIPHSPASQWQIEPCCESTKSTTNVQQTRDSDDLYCIVIILFLPTDARFRLNLRKNGPTEMCNFD
jgi:hypothetical protein